MSIASLALWTLTDAGLGNRCQHLRMLSHSLWLWGWGEASGSGVRLMGRVNEYRSWPELLIRRRQRAYVRVCSILELCEARFSSRPPADRTIVTNQWKSPASKVFFVNHTCRFSTSFTSTSLFNMDEKSEYMLVGYADIIALESAFASVSNCIARSSPISSRPVKSPTLGKRMHTL